MKQLLTLYFHFLPLAAHFDFFKKLAGLLSAAGAALKTAIEALMPDFNAWLDKEDAVMRWVRKSVLTEQIAEADRYVDLQLSAINTTLKAAVYGNTDVAAAAVRLLALLKNYGRIAKKSYDEQAGDVRVLLEQFSGPYYSDVGFAGIGYRVALLTEGFNKFEKLLRQRETEQGEKPPYTGGEVRKGIEAAYRQIERVIDANAVVGASGDFEAFIDLLNPVIDHLNAEFHHAKKDLGVGDHTVIEPVDTQKYTEKPVTPVPEVHYREDGKETKRLYLGKDFSITYKNNVEVGQAELTIHGKGDYKGQKSLSFHIAR